MGFRILGVFVGLVGVVFGQLPRMTIEDGGHRQDLEVKKVEVRVQVSGEFVETRMTLEFFNKTGLNQEGEFRLPLPEGSSVHFYALEVNGEMREATVVGKERARRAYETIKAQNIDPGIVEKMEGNVYRTRIFPVLPKSSKRVSIGYVQRFSRVGVELRYSLPFGIEEAVDRFELVVAGDLKGVKIGAPEGLSMERVDGELRGGVVNSGVEGALVLKRAVRDEAVAEVCEVGGERFVTISAKVPAKVLAAKGKRPGSLTVFWDASASGYSRDLKAEVGLLGALVTELSDVSVRLVAVHGEVEELGVFEVKGGDWGWLRAAVEGIFYDGLADWRGVNFGKVKGSSVLLFGGSAGAYPVERVDVDGVLHVVRSGGVGVSDVFSTMAGESGGGVLDLGVMKVGDCVKDVVELRARVVRLDGFFSSCHVEMDGERVRILAKLSGEREGDVGICFGYGDEVVERVPLVLKKAEGGEMLRYLWAEQELAEMVARGSFLDRGDERELVDFCKWYGLVSDFTSMIVLERMEDHVRFEIPPPEKELLAAYKEGLKKRKGKLLRSGHDYLESYFKDRSKWYAKDYPWMEVLLYPRYFRVRDWTRAQVSCFSREQLAQTNVGNFLDWKKEAEGVMKARKGIETKAEFLAWRKRIDEMLARGEKLGEKDVGFPEGEFGVSVRGLVNEPQTLSVKKGVTLKKVVEAAGGFHSKGDQSRVAVYRGGKRVIYNLLSDQYVDVALLPGDMVVAMAEDYGDEWGSDPFSDGGGDDEVDSAKAPAVAGGDAPLKMPSGRGDPFGGASEGGGPEVDLKGAIRVGVVKSDGGDLKRILAADDVWGAYVAKRGEMGGDMMGLAGVAGRLYELREVARARRVLGNFCVREGVHVPSLRAMAYWMMQYGDYEGAWEVFGFIEEGFPGDALVCLDLVRLQRLRGGEGELSGRLRSMFGTEKRGVRGDHKKSRVLELVILEQQRRGNQRSEGLLAPDITVPFLKLEHEGVFDADIRVLMSSAAGDQSYRLSVDEPLKGGVLRDGTSLTGGRVIQGGGVSEYMMRYAMPGTYGLKIMNSVRGTYQVEVYLNWGKADEERRMFTVSGDGSGGYIDAGEVEFEMK